MSAWQGTDSLRDGTPVMFITDDAPATPGFSIVENEDGRIFQVPSLDLVMVSS